MKTLPVFHGNESEALRLMQTAESICECHREDGVVRMVCWPHRMLTDQRFLDGLLFVWHNPRFRTEEFE